MTNVDTRYGYRAWDRRPGDNVDPSLALGPEETIYGIMAQAPVPPSAGIMPRLLGYARGEMTIEDVLHVGPGPTLMRNTPTRQDAGVEATLRPATGPW